MDDDVDEKRYERLGFRPQKEIVYNKLLPYADKLDEESAQLYADIKTNLIKSVMAREMKPGCAEWASYLMKYIKIYGMKFSKEDHIGFIKLFYELLIIPDLEATRINKFTSTLTKLLKKRDLISRDELQLEWRPLYELYLRVKKKIKSDVGMCRDTIGLKFKIMDVIRFASIYFPASATEEMLDEFRPKLCPMDHSMYSSIQYLDVFLPVHVKPEEAAISYELWFKELMTLWNVCHNANGWEYYLMLMIARLSKCTMGYIDWEPYIPTMFVRFSRGLFLPVAYKQRQIGSLYMTDTSSMALWITCTLNGDKNSTFFHLEKFMQALESYFYFANSGLWTFQLRAMLKKLAYYFVERVHSERFKKKTWEVSIPEHYKLSDGDIDRFVRILKPCLEQAMFSRQGGEDIGLALQYLSSLRPNMIIPMTLDKLRASMDSLTEPHKLTSSMMAVTAVAKNLAQGAKNDYPQGLTHVVPILLALLPGIDPNDTRKCLMTFNLIVQYVNMIPLINSLEASKHHENLTEEEHIVCEASDGFEDFILQFFDQLCHWVESNSLDFVRLEQVANSGGNRKSRGEKTAEKALFTMISAILHQCSPDIFTAALKKVFNFATERILEIQISGKMVAIMCQGFAKVNPKETMKLFIPHLCDIIERLLDENPNVGDEEHLDPELLYNLQMLSEIVDARTELVHYSARLMSILDRTLHMASLSASQMAARLLENMMSSLTYLVPTEYRSSATPYGTHVKDFLSIREWGKAQNIRDLKISWYVPGDKEIALVQLLITKYLVPEIDKLNKFASGELSLSRQHLRRSLNIVVSNLSSQPVLPIWDEPAIKLVDSVVEPWAFNLIVIDSHAVNMPDGANVRKVIADLLHRVQRRILEVDEGDTKSILLIVHVYYVLLFNKSRAQVFEYNRRDYRRDKKFLEDRLHQNKLHLRHMLINRVVLHQKTRMRSSSAPFTQTHKQILLDLFELSVSRYSEVRISAQAKLFSIVSAFPHSHLVLSPHICDVLKLNSEEHHEKFKGCLYVLLGPNFAPIVARRDWNFIRQLWPLIVQSMPSEKPSIVNLIERVVASVNMYFPTIAIKLVFPQKCLDAANVLTGIVPNVDLGNFQKCMNEGEKILELKCDGRAVAYKETVEDLLDACINANLHWRYHSIALTFLKYLAHYDVKYSVDIIKYFLQALINESIKIRKTAIMVVVIILKQNKPKFKKIDIDRFAISTCKTDATQKLVPGLREDNKWLLYDSETVPMSTAEWEKPRFLHDQNIGFYAWPTKVETYSPPLEQPHIDKRWSQLTPEEKEIYDFFNTPANLDLFFKYFSMEEKKGWDWFNTYKFLLFKNLFKIFEDKLLDQIIPHVEKLVADKNESSQRCAAELMSGIIRGSKHWSFDKTVKLWSLLIPLLRTAMANMSNETMSDWGTSMTNALRSRDPNRHHWLLEFLIKDPLTKDQTSLVACGRLQMLNSALSQQTWRNTELALRLKDYFKAHLSHPFQDVRNKIGDCLVMIFSKELIWPGSAEMPAVRKFLQEIQPTLDQLYSYSLSKVDADPNLVSTQLQTLSLSNEETRENATRLFKLVSKYLTSSVVQMNYSTLPEYFNMIPLCCVLQSNDTDDEIAPVCSNLLAALAYTVTIREHVPAAIEAIRNVATCPFWSARAAITEFMSPFIFHNMPTIISKREWVLEIQRLVLDLLEDVQPEVRNSAAQVLSGLLHCQFIPNQQELLIQFKQKAKTKVERKSKYSAVSVNVTNTLRYKHAGVLGLCAFINSHPYDVPDYLPDIFGTLGPHLNDPQPIPATIIKTLGDFKRTHQENWEIHKLTFTQEELSVLSDLTVPPSYCA